MASIYRRLFFWIFVILFLATTPVAILYSQGYRFDQYKKIFVHSGSVTVKSVPSGVNIFINGELQPSGALDIINNSITVNGLRPGNYSLRVAADGYKDWEKNIEVHSGVSTEFWNVYLAPQNLQPRELSADGAEKIFPSASGDHVAFFKKNGASFEVWTLGVKDNQPALIFAQDNLEFSGNPTENIEWNSKEELLLVPVVQKEKNDFLILDSAKSRNPFFLSQALPNFAEINRVRWNPGNQNEIYFTAKTGGESQNDLYRMDLSSSQPELILDGVKAFDLSNGAIYVLKQNNIACKTNLDGKNEEQLALSPITFSDPDAEMRLIAYDDFRQAFISEAGEMFVHNNGETGENLEKIADNAKGAQFSDDGKKLLFWNNNEISVLFLRKWDVQPRREENEIQQIIRFSSPLKNVFWHQDYEHVFFSTQNFVKMVELDSRDRRTLIDLFKYNSENFSSSYNSPNGIYFFLDEAGGMKKIFYLFIPEQTNIFGG